MACRIGVKLVEVRHARGQVGVGKQLDCLCFRTACKQGGYVLFDCPLLQQACELLGPQHGIA